MGWVCRGEGGLLSNRKGGPWGGSFVLIVIASGTSLAGRALLPTRIHPTVFQVIGIQEEHKRQKFCIQETFLLYFGSALVSKGPPLWEPINTPAPDPAATVVLLKQVLLSPSQKHPNLNSCIVSM